MCTRHGYVWFDWTFFFLEEDKSEGSADVVVNNEIEETEESDKILIIDPNSEVRYHFIYYYYNMISF